MPSVSDCPIVVGYIICMVPSNIALRITPPHFFFGAPLILFGICACAMASARSYGAVIVLRILIGGCQSFVQSLSTYISLWYKRDEVATRAG
jgi:hypothetical protein